jgi:hypothetical protein
VHVASNGYEQFPDWPHGRQSVLEMPMNAAKPALKQRQRGKPFVERTANPAGSPGARDKATLTAKVLLDGKAETLMRLRQLFVEWAYQAGDL